MSKRRTHIAVGFGAGALAGWLAAHAQGRQASLSEILTWGGVGSLGSLLPDALEPATYPWHRDVAHSVVTLGAAAYLATQAPRLVAPAAVPLVLAGLSGLGSHILADSTNPSGVPLLRGPGHTQYSRPTSPDA